jgi:YesN/AraC family two-component response regulator
MNNQLLSNRDSKFQILFVEDDEELLEYLGLRFREDHTVYSASNGFQALEIFAKHSVDLIVSDVNMPVLNGFDLFEKIRRQDKNLTPFLFLTVNSNREALLKGLVMGVDAYMTKPFDMDELIIRVNSILINNSTRKEIYLKNSQAAISQPQVRVLKEEETASFKTRWLKQVEDVLTSELSNRNIKIPDIAFKLALSERTFRKRIKAYTGLSPHEYLMNVRMAKALYLFENKVYMNVGEVATAVGLDSTGYFSKNFKERYGKLPSEFRKD